MADNYLERKMEEYRRQSKSPVKSSPSKGKLSFNFPPRRVIIYNIHDQSLINSLTKAYSEIGCKVAVYPAVESATEIFNGARQITSTDNPSIDLASVFKAWGDIDIVLTTDRNPDNFIQSIVTNRQSSPYPNDYGLRIILIGEHNFPQPSLPVQCDTNIIEITEQVSPANLRKIVSSALFLSLFEMTGLKIIL